MPLTGEAVEPLLRLALVPGVGHLKLAQLLGRFGTAQAVLAAPHAALRGVPGIGPELARRIRNAGGEEARRETHRALKTLERTGASILLPADPVYPAGIRSLPDPPQLLFAAGNLELLRLPGVAIVGTRTPTPYGRQIAESLAHDLAAAGFAVVSGMARGIDGAAHRGAIRAAGATIGVLGHGIEGVYPPESGRLFRAVRESGLLLTEYPPGETPKPGNFPRRNRIITALSAGVVVVEMGFRSGAQHTVTFALEQGREVMAVPGPIGSPTSEGTNQLIKDGARMVTSVMDVLEEISGVGSAGGQRPATHSPPDPDLRTAEERQLVGLIGAKPIAVDTLVTSSGLSSPVALATLLELELRGVVRALPGMRYARG